MWSFINETLKQSKEKVDSLGERTDNVEFSLGLVSEKMSNLEQENKRVKEDLLYLQSQSMRNNLVFGNIEEKENERIEETEAELRNFMVSKFKMAQDCVNDIKFERVHRLGQRSERVRNRNIVAKFTLFKDREMVKKQGKHLNRTGYYMFEQYPREISEKRKALVPQMKEAKQAGHRAWISYDKLYVNGKVVKNSTGSG